MEMPGRTYSTPSYRYGFQGQEKDDEVKGVSGGSVNYKYRMHDPRVGRFFAVDPLAAKYSFQSPYIFSENRVIDMLEMEGLEGFSVHSYYSFGQLKGTKVIVDEDISWGAFLVSTSNGSHGKEKQIGFARPSRGLIMAFPPFGSMFIQQTGVNVGVKQLVKEVTNQVTEALKDVIKNEEAQVGTISVSTNAYSVRQQIGDQNFLIEGTRTRTTSFKGFDVEKTINIKAVDLTTDYVKELIKQFKDQGYKVEVETTTKEDAKRNGFSVADPNNPDGIIITATYVVNQDTEETTDTTPEKVTHLESGTEITPK